MKEQRGLPAEPPELGEASLVIWDWRKPEADASSESRRRLRRRGWLRAALGLAVAVAFALAGWRTLALVAAAFALLGGIGATFAPEGFEKVLGRFTGLVGQTLTFLLLVPVYLLFFTPFGWFFRSGRRDRMTPHWEAGATTYWTARAPLAEGTESLKRQF